MKVSSANLFEKRILVILGAKTGIVACALFLAYLFRFDFSIPAPFWKAFWANLPFVLAIKLTIFWIMGLTHGWWRYVSLSDVFHIFKANVFASLGFILFAVFFRHMEGIPRSVLILDGILCFLMACGIRFATRAFRENYFPMPSSGGEPQSRSLIVGAGDAGQMIVREIRQNPKLKKKIVGFIDDDHKKQNQRFQGFKVLGTQKDLARICRQENVEEVIIAIPSASGRQLRSIIDHCEGAGVRFKTLPGVGDLINGRVSVQQVREVDVQDLLGRKPVRLDVEQIRSYLLGKCILITGAAGSIGSELCRQVARFGPAKLVLFDSAESPLFFIERELAEKFPELHLSAVIGDIRDRTRVEAIFDEFMPQVVFHAAAYKHVPMMEHNPAEAANNNVRGTRNLADAAHKFKTRHFVMVSTDKAVNPTNIMGTTKRAAELYIQSLAAQSATNFVTVRFGNVLGSAGSVVPIFKDQIRQGGPVKVTHPEVTRFFMTIPEAAQLVLQAGSMGRGGEIFLLDMGEPVKIVHLAEELIRLSGLRPYEDVEITFTGLRPGEKLYEELLLAGEGIMPTTHEKIRVARAAQIDRDWLLQKLEELYWATKVMDLKAVVGKLMEIVPEYRPDPGKAEASAGDTKKAPRVAAQGAAADGSPAGPVVRQLRP